MPPEVVQAVEAAQRARLLPWEDVAHQIGVSPPQLSNVLKGRFGLSPRAAANLKEWLAAA
jgi:methylphosphotriester-DNA--protein-cysteine methyltransferase